MADTGTQSAERPARPAAGAALFRPAQLHGRRRLDLATLAGLTGGLGMVVGVLAMGGALAAFLDPAAIMIVLGGTVAVTAISFSPPQLADALRAVGRTLVNGGLEMRAAARAALALATQARQGGPLALQPLLRQIKGQPVLSRAVELTVDGVPSDEAERILRTEIEANQARAKAGGAVLRRAAEVAPAMGLIGTVLGLIQMLGHLDDPSKIGSAMAVALMTTFYGAVTGNMVLAPLAMKVEKLADQTALVEQIWLLTASSIARQENPRRLEMMINTILPPEQRLANYD